MLMSSAAPLTQLENESEFIARHIGISEADEKHMLSVIGEASRRALIDSIVPASIARSQAMKLPAPVTEAGALAELKAMAQQNKILKSFIGQGHGLGSSSSFVQHGSVGNGHGRQIANHGLEVDQGFHAALTDFGLVGCVGGVPSGVFQDVTQNHAGCVSAVITLANEALEYFVLLRHGFELSQRSGLCHGRRQLHGLTACNGGGHDAVNERAA